MSTEEQIVERAIDEGMRQQMVAKADAILARGATVRSPILEIVSGLREALSSNDWAKWGVITALLWFKFDKLIALLDKVATNTDGANKVLDKVAGELRSVVARLR